MCEMGSDVEEELLGLMSTPTPTPWRKLLQIHTTTTHDMPPSPTRSGMQTPPFHTTAAIPFGWEEEPGKPWPCTALILVPKQQGDSSSKSLRLPPRLLNEAITASGGRLLEGPRPQGSNLQIGGECYGSTVLEGRFLGWGASGFCKGGWEGKRKASRSGGKMDILGSSSYVFPSGDSRECDQDSSFGVQEKGKGRIRRAGSSPLLTHARSHFWRSIWEGLKGARSRSKGIKL
ncbi:hypothetical protein MLD38_036330 [Melastoma candidum]|uniref:Uncharacterized protein n=1 Tax=Melastoma candidum TaxID=119954 RepID=A0ACB9LJ77_9MYRT|nr:hypothetical protein MLD38_036330 [Melastoma candidum]